MMCAWNELIGILPLWMRQEVDQSGKADAQELRLRLKGPPELVLEGTSRWLEGTVTIPAPPETSRRIRSELLNVTQPSA